MEPTNPIPSAAELEAKERQRRKELQEYRANKPKVWYLK